MPRETPQQIYEKRVRDVEQLTGGLVPPLELSQQRPEPPRGVMLSGTTIRWEPPREIRNVTHFLIYSPDERTLVHRAPLDQRIWVGLNLASTALVSTWNEVAQKESRKVPAGPWEGPLPPDHGGNGNGDGSGHIIADEGVALPAQPILDFTGEGVTVTDSNGRTVVTISKGEPGEPGPPGPAGIPVGVDGTIFGYASSGGTNIEIQDEGISVGRHTVLNFVGAGVTAVDSGSLTTITIPGGGSVPGDVVTSVFGRPGPVIVAAPGDYTAAQVTNAVDATQSYADPAWLTSLSYGKLTGVPATFPPSPHTHPWTDLTGVPSTFPPSAHTHDAADTISGVFTTARLGTGAGSSSNYLRGDGTWTAIPAGDWNTLVNKPSTFPPSAHTHPWGEITGAPSTFPPSAHTHAASEITSGVMATARLGTGTANSTTYLRGDGTWATVSTGASQTPWLQHVDANYFYLQNLGYLYLKDENRRSDYLAGINMQLGNLSLIASSFAGASYGTSIGFFTSDTPGAATTVKMRIMPDGMVGIGKDAYYKLDVAGDVNIPTGNSYRINGSPHTHAYSELTGLPSSFPPSAHTHPWSAITGEATSINFTDVTGPKLDLFGGQYKVEIQPAEMRFVVSSGSKFGFGTTTNGTDYTERFAIDGSGSVFATTYYGSGAGLNSVPWSAITGAPSAGNYQTPWLQNIDGATFALTNVSQIGINAGASGWSLDVRQRGAALETTAGALRYLMDVACSNGNNDRIETTITRDSAGGDWTVCSWKWQRVVDASPMQYIRFYGGSEAVQLGGGAGAHLTADNVTVSIPRRVYITGGSGTGYATAPLEIYAVGSRIAFHWPGVASQIGITSAGDGTIRTFNNPGTGYENFACAHLTASGNVSATSSVYSTNNMYCRGAEGYAGIWMDRYGVQGNAAFMGLEGASAPLLWRIFSGTMGRNCFSVATDTGRATCVDLYVENSSGTGGISFRMDGFQDWFYMDHSGHASAGGLRFNTNGTTRMEMGAAGGIFTNTYMWVGGSLTLGVSAGEGGEIRWADQGQAAGSYNFVMDVATVDLRVHRAGVEFIKFTSGGAVQLRLGSQLWTLTRDANGFVKA